MHGLWCRFLGIYGLGFGSPDSRVLEEGSKVRCSFMGVCKNSGIPYQTCMYLTVGHFKIMRIACGLGGEFGHVLRVG